MQSGLQVPSRRFGAYTLQRPLGEGGMAVVHLAEAIDERGELLQVALKFMKPPQAGVDALDLFATEADLMGLLRHPNLVELHEVGKFEDQLYLALEYLPGGDLAALLAALRRQGRPFPHALALRVGIDLLKALSYVHQAQGARGTSLGLVHGDVNPSNIFLALEPSRAKLGDFGVATSSALGGGLPEGMSAGKLHYLSPEAAQGRPLVPGSDLFAVGVVMFELLFGCRPFEGADTQQVLGAIAEGRHVHPEGISPQLASIFERALAKSPKARFATAGAFAGELLRYQLEAGLQEREDDLGALLEESLEILC